MNRETDNPDLEASSDAEETILIVDDEPAIRLYLSTALSKRQRSLILCSSAEEAMETLQERQIWLVLTDISMRGASGLELLQWIRSHDPDIPVILMTGHADLDVAVEAMNKGAFHFITKPFNTEYLMSAVTRGLARYAEAYTEKNYTVLLENTVMRKTRELEDTALMANRLSLELVQRLSAVAEFRDSYTAAHISRIGLYSRYLAEAMGMYGNFVEAIAVASSLHDIGKIGIPDNILLKNIDLTGDERRVIQTHAVMGSRILQGSSHPTIQMAYSIALHHHEHWDGTGYPSGLRGSEIPVEARIVRIADQYDALRSVRSYKPSFDHRKACSIILAGDDRTSPDHFDPEVLRLFSHIAPEFDRIFIANQD